MKKRHTLKDIAQALNKSVATISRALSNSPEVGIETTALVQTYAKKIGYSFNASAKGLRTGKSYIIGIIINNFDNSFYAQLMEGIEEALSKIGYRVLVMQSKGDPFIEKHCIEALYSYNIDGLIISPIGNSPNIDRIQQLIDSDFPVVVTDRINNQLKAPKVGIKNQFSTFQAMNTMISFGRKRIVHITGRTAGVTAERLLGYKQSLIQNTIPVNPELIIEVDLLDATFSEILTKKLEHLYSKPQRPDAIFCAVDQITNLMGSIIHRLHLDPVHESSIFGFSNMTSIDSFFPIWRIEQPAIEMGHLAVNLLFSLFNQNLQINNHPLKIELETTLIPPLMHWNISHKSVS